MTLGTPGVPFVALFVRSSFRFFDLASACALQKQQA